MDRLKRIETENIKDIYQRLKRRTLHGSFKCAEATIDLLRQIIINARCLTIQDLFEVVQEVGKHIISAQPLELAVFNVIARVLFIIRQELHALKTDINVEVGTPTVDQLHTLLVRKDHKHDLSQPLTSHLRSSIIDQVTALADEISQNYQYIADQAPHHIHAKEVILSFGFSRSVLNFLRAAAEHREFEVIVAESEPHLAGQQLSLKLASVKGIRTTVITDSAIFAMMSRVNTVIIGVHAVLANGGLLAKSGSHALAVAAKTHSVPLIVVTGVFKLSPLYAFDQDTFNQQFTPNEVIDIDQEGPLLWTQGRDPKSVSVLNPALDYIPPHFVSLYITDIGAHSPSYIYRLLSEYYHHDDYNLAGCNV